MFLGFLEFDEVEICNASRTVAYANRLLPGLDLRGCDPCSNFHHAVGDTAYYDPRYDTAPWYRLAEPHSEDFYGLYPLRIDGIEDSSIDVTRTDLLGDGAVHSRIRNGAKDIRVRGLLVARSQQGLEIGRRWLRSVLEREPCGRGRVCGGTTLTFFSNCPGAPTSAAANETVAEYRRTMYNVEQEDGLRTVQDYVLPASGAHLAEIEFTLSAGVPWAFSDLSQQVTTTGLSPTTVAETWCDPYTDAYQDLILDPADAALPQAPRPPVPDVLTMPTSWKRYMAVIPQSVGDPWGRLGHVVTVTSKAAPLRMVRVRFYKDTDALPGIDVGACGWEGEFLVTYMPAWSTLTIDGIRRNSTISINAGPAKPAGHLVLGSNGRPPTWPHLACESAYLVVVDSVDTLSDRYVLVSTAVGS